MSTQTDPFAMVQPDSAAQKNLLALGWTLTDSLDGWDHMEPPLNTTSLVVESLNMREGDGLILTAAGIAEEQAADLRWQVDCLLAGKQDAIVVDYDIKVLAIHRPTDTA